MYFVPDMLALPFCNFRRITGFGCVLLLIGCKMPVKAQERYQILFQDRPIGHIEASRQGSRSDRVLRIRSSVQVKLVLNYQLNTQIEAE